MVLLAALFIVLALASIAAWGFRHLNGPFPTLTAGVIVGIIAGPTIAGRVLPTMWESVFAGAVRERNEVRALSRDSAAWNVAAAHVGEQRAPEHPLEAEVLNRNLVQAETRYRQPWRVLTGVLVLLGVAMSSRVAIIVLPGLTALSILYIDVVTAHSIVSGWWLLAFLVGVAAVGVRASKAPQVPA